MRSHLIGTLSLALALASAAASFAGDPGDSDWLRGLQGKRVATRGDVLLAAALLLDDAHWEADPAWALRSATGHRLVRGDDASDVSGNATRAFACSVFARALGIRGGVLMRLTGQSGRYAYRELRLHGLIPDGPSHLSLSGDELVGLLDGATKFREHGPVRPTGL